VARKFQFLEFHKNINNRLKKNINTAKSIEIVTDTARFLRRKGLVE